MNSNGAANGTSNGLTNEDQNSSTNTKAPQSDEAVPDGAALYSPKAGYLDVADFTKWANDKFANPDATPSHWIKLPAGEYKYFITDGGQQTVMFWGARNSKEPSQPGTKWTVDLRGCTFKVPIIKETNGNPPAAIYVAQSNDLRILGGTFWSMWVHSSSCGTLADVNHSRYWQGIILARQNYLHEKHRFLQRCYKRHHYFRRSRLRHGHLVEACEWQLVGNGHL